MTLSRTSSRVSPSGLPSKDARDHLVAANVMVDHPGRQADRRIDDSVQRLRAVVHLEGVAQPVLVEVVELVPRVFFIGREAGRRRAAHREAFDTSGGTVAAMLV